MIVVSWSRIPVRVRSLNSTGCENSQCLPRLTFVPLSKMTFPSRTSVGMLACLAISCRAGYDAASHARKLASGSGADVALALTRARLARNAFRRRFICPFPVIM
ncbi:hypothetical protein D9M71_457770 [compost metagenome]